MAQLVSMILGCMVLLTNNRYFLVT